MNTEKTTSLALKISVAASIAVIIAGLIVSFAFENECVLKIGILLLIVTPLVSIVAATVSLAIGKEWKWVCAAIVLVAVTVAGMLIEYCG